MDPTITTIITSIIAIILAYIIGNYLGKTKNEAKWQTQLPEYRKDAINRSRAVLGGHFSEQLSPYLPDFPFSPTECKFLGKPIDLIVFKGSDEKNINEIVFVEVKSGKSKLSPQEKNLKEAIEKKNVKWVEYRIPEDITKKKDVDDLD